MGEHVVRAGDTWWNVAKRYHVSLPELVKWNPQIAHVYPLPMNARLTIPELPSDIEEERVKLFKQSEGKEEISSNPSGSEMSNTEPEPDSATGTVAMSFTPFPIVSQLSEPKFSNAEPWGKLGTHVCNHGDTWEAIAERYYITVEHLKAANPHLLNLSWLQPGLQINIPSIGITFYEQMKNKPQKSKQQHPDPIPQPYTEHSYMAYPYSYMSAKDLIQWPYAFYRCMCPNCMRMQNPIPLEQLEQMEHESESFVRFGESSSFWGSSSYLESATFLDDDSSSWMAQG